MEYPGLEGLGLARASLVGRGVVVTGGSTGIGYACAGEVLAAGGRVVIAARGAAALAAAVEGLGAEYGADRVRGVVAEVGEEGSVAHLFAEAEGWLGGVDGVVHAAAVLGPIGPTAEVAPAEWLDAVRVNLFGSYLVSAAAARVLGARGGGSLVLLSGGGAATPFPRYTAYACGKAGVVRLAESLAEELAPSGIRVNALAPGFVATRIHAETLAAGSRAGGDYLRRTREQLAEGGVPPELAGRAAVFLLSDESAGITGRLVSAPWDRWWEWPARRGEIEGGDLFTLRRIVPRDRGGEWQ
jgi:NAD(P)-dependent dehydrogenase (short-subunit alcohol dehydrogenase family)